MEKEVKVKVVYEEGYEKRYTEAVLRAYEKKAKRENTAVFSMGSNGNGNRGSLYRASAYQ